MKGFLMILVLFFGGLLGEISAQEKFTNEIVPDVTLTDIYGETYQLYDTLASGKSVIINFFATWCSPCWTYHESGELQSIWETYGPDGSDELAIFFVESDPGTTLADLSQGSDNSLGDYLSDSPYPVLDDSELANIFEISHFPSVFYICPDKRVTQVNQMSLSDVANALENTCDIPDLNNNLELLYFTNDFDPVCLEEEVLPTVMVQNIGTNTIKEIACQLYMNGQPWGSVSNFDVWLNTYETLELAFGPFLLDETTNFTIDLLEVNNEDDADPDGNSMTMSKEWPKAYYSDVTLKISTDDFGLETSWELRDEFNNILASGGEYPSNTTITENINLINFGCYELKVFDSYGDGMCCNYNEGSYELLDADSKPLLSGGRFLKEDSGSFEFSSDLAASSEEIIDELAIVLFPNPAANELHLTLDQSLPFNNVDISDATGRIIFSKKIIGHHHTFDVSSFAPGIYFLSVSTDEMKSARSFIISE